MIATTHGELEIKEERSAARAQTSASTSLFQTSDPSVRFLSFHVLLLHNLGDTTRFHFLVIQGGNREARNHYIRNLLLIQPPLHMPRWPRCGDGKSKFFITSCNIVPFPTLKPNLSLCTLQCHSPTIITHAARGTSSHPHQNQPQHVYK